MSKNFNIANMLSEPPKKSSEPKPSCHVGKSGGFVRDPFTSGEMEKYQAEVKAANKAKAQAMWEDEPVNGDLYCLYDKENNTIMTEEQIHAFADKFGRRTP